MNMNNNILILIIFVILMVNTNSLPENGSLTQSSPHASYFHYFPLAVGNKWFFKDNKNDYDDYIFTVLHAVCDTVVTNGYHYTRIDRYDRGGNIIQPDTFKLTRKGYYLLREEGGSIISYPDSVIFDYRWQIGDTIFYDLVSYVTVDTIYTENIFGRYLSTCVLFNTFYDYHTFTDSIGFNVLHATTWHNWNPRYLTGCVIDNVQHGDIILSLNDLPGRIPLTYRLH